ncbi:efflux RND transporter periplasmic adaptor subunit [Sphingomonas canadensis]|uniref:Efflux RND transporter periplasmic adaptor subunit n=1 Tax=Sphingomonas canadensis TaxID=1219257 RepID=A0ABW3H5C7_9SPHN|nr:efflux RND transporter periplasmic adaptor subunit [Sphingomonas canadensis]MCW3834727.1 efflux RND transporter periplasmic adaptor subunit [Sphingomonas canadensis]
MATDTTTDLSAFLGAKQHPRWRRWAMWGAIGVGALLLVLLASRWMGGGSEVRYATATAEQGNLSVTVSATGKLAPTNQVEVGSELSGLVTKVLVDVNDRVTKGQPLAELDVSRLDDAITQSRATLAANQASVALAQATLAQDRAQLARLQEVSRLSGGRVPSKTEMEQAEAAVARDMANVRAAQANVVSARAALSSNETQRYKAVIRSPVNGVVLARQVDEGQTVAASFNTPTLFVIAEDLGEMKLEVAVDEADVADVKEGQSASFTVDAFPGRSFPATITRVDVGSNLSATSSSSSTTSSSASVVSYGTTLSVANGDMLLRPGMTATATIVTQARQNVLTVPNAALRFTPASDTAAASSGNSSGIAGALVPGPRRRSSTGTGQGGDSTAPGSRHTVYILGADGTPQPVAVVIGITNGTLTEVTGGELKPGMKVITGQLASATSASSSSGSSSSGSGSSGTKAKSGGGGGSRAQ